MGFYCRGSAAERFPDRERFVEFKASGALETPEVVAAKVLAFAARADFGAEPVGDRIWFAGEALAGGLKQTAAGARLSGEAVAGQVALRLHVQDHPA